jgi:gamma-glutamyltranspeptidase / glutathione hydrolase
MQVLYATEAGKDMRNGAGRAWVVAHEPLGAEITADLLTAGRHLAPAIVAGALAQGAAAPLWTSLGGFGVALVRQASAGEALALGFHAVAPLTATEDMFETVERAGGGTPGTYEVVGRENQLGYRSVATPGLPAGLASIARLGPPNELSQALEPVEDLLREGVPVSHHTYSGWVSDTRSGYEPPLKRFLATPAARAIYAPDGKLPLPGARIVNPDYAALLERLGAAGFGDFSQGEVAERIAADFAANGGLISAFDLERYQVREGSPITRDYRGLRVETAPLPSLGLLLVDALEHLQGEDLGRLEPESPHAVDLVARAIKNASNALDARVASGALPVGGQQRRASIPRDTTHIIGVDEHDNIISFSHSLGAASGVVTEGLGFIYNGAMHRFDPVPGRADSIRPGASRLTGMAPAIIWSDERPEIVIGGAGGLGIIQGILQVLVRIIDHRMDPQAAVCAPRFAVYGRELMIEAGYPLASIRELRRRGYAVSALPDALDRDHVGRVAVLSRYGGVSWRGGADPRAAGAALEVGTSPRPVQGM